MKRRVLLALLSAALLFSFGCSSNNPPESGPEPQTPAPPPESEVKYYNPLTGLETSEAAAQNRPIAVMINNIRQALPQKGISRADMIIEFPTEGDTGRLLAVFYDYADVEEIGTVRSSRDYFIDYAQALGAVYLHYGGSPQAYAELKKGRVDNLDGMTAAVDRVLYWRDSDRIRQKGYEHSVFTSGERIVAALEAFDMSPLAGGVSPYYNFGEPDMSQGFEASSVTLPYSSSLSPTFEYDEQSGLYKRFQFSEAHIDALYDDSQLALKTLFIAFADTRTIAGDDAGRLAIETAGEGEGFFVTGGRALEVTWKKESDDDMISFYDGTGGEITVAPGKIWLCVFPSNRASRVSFE